MRLFFIVLFSFTITLVNVAQTNTETILSSAQKHFENKDYNKTIELYEDLIAEGYNSTDLYFNLGTAYFENNDLISAILYYEKVLKKKPYNKAAKTNLKIANDLRASDVTLIPDFFMVQWWRNFSKILGSKLWSLLGFISIASSLFFLWKFLLKTPMRRYLLSAILFALLGFIILLAARTSYKLSNQKNHVLNMTNVSLLKGPDENSSVGIEIPAGEKLKIEDRIGEWIKVSLINKDEGWINESLATPI